MAFSISPEGFHLDGAPFQVISGSLHYFRVHPDLWADRLDKACHLGLNTIDTYVAWNFHSRREGEFRLDGWRDLGRFLDLTAERDLKAIVRPGPYICAEWRNGGLPTWLTARDLRLRTSDPQYLAIIADYYRHVLPLVSERQATRGGNVIMLQVENEYGAYGDDKDYLRSLVELIRAQDIDIPLFTCDQANDEMLSRGSLPELLSTATFGSRSTERLAVLRRHQPTGPLMCTEFWDGWFDSWGEHHRTTDPSESARDLDELLSAGASVNLYMFHGGTNFELNNGANHKGTYTPIVTSYDYDAPLSEDGSRTPKFDAFQDVITRHNPANHAWPGDTPRGQQTRATLHRAGDWSKAATEPAGYDHLPAMDLIDPEARFAVYSTQVHEDDALITFDDVRDRAFVFLDNEPVGSIHRTMRQRAVALPRRAGVLSILVEDLGRVNYASRLGEPKGLIGEAITATRRITDWTVSSLDHTVLPHIALQSSSTMLDGPEAGPVLVHGSFQATGNRDLFLDTQTFGTGLAWVNGLLLGRYWSAGPTTTMYVPGPLLRDGTNDLVLWELEALTIPTAEFVTEPQLGHTEA